MTEWLFWVAVGYFTIGAALGLWGTVTYLRESAEIDRRLVGGQVVLIHMIKGMTIAALAWPFALLLALFLGEED